MPASLQRCSDTNTAILEAHDETKLLFAAAARVAAAVKAAAASDHQAAAAAKEEAKDQIVPNHLADPYRFGSAPGKSAFSDFSSLKKKLGGGRVAEDEALIKGGAAANEGGSTVGNNNGGCVKLKIRTKMGTGQ